MGADYKHNRVRFTTGTYEGDGTLDFYVQGLGFHPRLVVVGLNEGSDVDAYLFMKTDQHPAALSWGLLALAFHKDQRTNMIILLDDDGFHVDDAGGNAHPNQLGVEYWYWAIGGGH